MHGSGTVPRPVMAVERARPAGALAAFIPLTGDAADAWHGETEIRELTGGARPASGAWRERSPTSTTSTDVSAAHISLAAMLREDVP